jgi:DNA repair protein RecO (recombination protein O)
VPGHQRERTVRVRAIVLRRTNTGETDRIVTLFTPEQGKLSAIARGARGPRSKLAGATEPAVCFRAQLARGQTLDVLTQAEVEHSFLPLRRDLALIGHTAYLLEVSGAAVEERQPAAELWYLLLESLTALQTATAPDVLARSYELRVLKALGLLPDLDRCVRDGAPILPGMAAFDPRTGGLLCRACSAATGTPLLTAAALRAFQVLPTTSAVEAGGMQLAQEERSELARLLPACLRTHLDAPLRSLRFLDSLR